MMHKSLQL